ncbi:MAG: DNA translocase FtsK [Clostridia bacterium]|nr:DNA translocase FtsK [Clostridia bacterium]
MILLLILTEVSLEKMFKAISLYIKRNREQMSAALDEEVDMEIDEKEPKQKKLKRRKEKAKKVLETETEAPAAKTPNNDYFDVYFKDDDIAAIAEGKGREKKPAKFRFDDEPQEEELDISDIASEVIAAYKQGAESPDRKKFEITEVNSGVLTPMPDENGVFKEESDEFEPPSLVQQQEKVDIMTQEALDRGIPIDRAVEAGKRIKHEEAELAKESINIVAKESIEATKIINYKLPSVSLLSKPKPKTKSRAEVKRELEEKANRLLETLSSFKVDATIMNITQGPTVTRFELHPGFGIKVSKITNLADDIALSLAASGVRIEAPIPGKSAIGIEIPNEEPSPVPIREVIDTDKFRDFKSKTAFALGKDISGNSVIADIAQFPHVLIAGATGSGKSVCINSLITSILYKAKPNEVKMIMIDPKMVELGVYNGIPHLLIPVVTDPRHAAGALNWAVAEMKNRYQLMKDNKVRNLQGYNALMEENGTPENKLPEIVIIIDELADLMLAAKNEVEDAINSLAALARAAGMYLVIATQRPSVDVITGVIKANVPSRISFAVSAQVDSKTILDCVGAEKLLGKGDMLYAARGAIKPVRIQGNFISDSEIENVIEFVKKQYVAEYDDSILEHIEREQESRDSGHEEETHTRAGEKDELFVKAAELAFESGQASVAMLQRKYKIGYQRAARIIDQLEENRIIGPYEGTKPRQVLITRNELNEMIMNNSD